MPLSRSVRSSWSQRRSSCARRRSPASGARPSAPRRASSALSLAATSTWNCSTVSTVSVLRLDLDRSPGRTGSASASLRIGGGIVALKSAVWRPFGREREDLLDVLEEAEVEHLVGLVEHDEAAARAGSASGGEIRSITRPTVPTTTWPPARSCACWVRIGAPPKTATTSMPLRLAVGAQRLRDLDAQLAGRREHERLDLVVRRDRRTRSIGRPKAAVLPVPVCAWPITSRPSSSGGIACSWIGLGSS